MLTPAGAIQRGPQGPFVFVVKPDKTIEIRNVVVGPIEQDVASIDKGLSPGEIVVIEGVEKLQAGDKGGRPLCEQHRRQGLWCVSMNVSRIFVLRPIATSLLNGRDPARRRRRLSPITGLGAAAGRVSNDSSDHVLSGSRPRGHGVVGYCAARAPVRTGPRLETDDLVQFHWKLSYHASVRTRSQHRCSCAGSAGRH